MQFDPLKLFSMCRRDAVLRPGLTQLWQLLGEGRHRVRYPAGIREHFETAGNLGGCVWFLSERFNVTRQRSGPLLGSCVGKKWDSRYKGGSASSCERGYNMQTILIVLVVLFLLGGGGWGYSRWRR
jgi:hypothetical protein